MLQQHLSDTKERRIVLNELIIGLDTWDTRHTLRGNTVLLMASPILN